MQAQQALPVSGLYYKIKNQNTGTTYIGGNGTGADAVKHENAQTNPAYQVFQIVGNNTDGWTLKQVETGNYIAHNVYPNAWTGGYETQATGDYTQLYKFDNTTSADFIIITKKGSSGSFSYGIGYDAAVSGSTLYFDKGTGNQN
ncbi:MAG: hypothetical protein LBV31_00065, partial [Prevotellaceae bacterium]|nr:hypothetical protein [Prevotellaceae bacterium]